MFAALSSLFCMLYLWNTSFYIHELHSYLLKERIHYRVSNNTLLGSCVLPFPCQFYKSYEYLLQRSIKDSRLFVSKAWVYYCPETIAGFIQQFIEELNNTGCK